MNSSEAFHFVTIQQSESHLEDLGTKFVQVCIAMFVCSLLFISPPPPIPPFLLNLLKFGSNNPKPKDISYKDHCSLLALSLAVPRVG